MPRRALYHLTWSCRVESILRSGLVPSHSPNRWAISKANLRSVGKVFLCEPARCAYWYDVFTGWVALPPGVSWAEASPLAWLRVNVTGLSLTADTPASEYAGDFWTDVLVPPERITVAEVVERHRMLVPLVSLRPRRTSARNP